MHDSCVSSQAKTCTLRRIIFFMHSCIMRLFLVLTSLTYTSSSSCYTLRYLAAFVSVQRAATNRWLHRNSNSTKACTKCSDLWRVYMEKAACLSANHYSITHNIILDQNAVVFFFCILNFLWSNNFWALFARPFCCCCCFRNSLQY